jgi:negative regulator of sigma E activity
MTCEKYKNALVEAAATGGNLEGGLAEHLELCMQCRARLQREQRLFATIDDSLRTRVNVMPRPGFLGDVCAEISKEALPKSQWNPTWALAGAALALAFIAGAHPWVRPNKQVVKAGSQKTSSIRTQQTAELDQSGQGATKTSNAPGRAQQHPTGPAVAKSVARRQPEVIVPPDEGKAFAAFVARLRQSDEVAQAYVSPAAAENNEPSQIPPVVIAHLQLKPLVWEKWK